MLQRRAHKGALLDTPDDIEVSFISWGLASAHNICLELKNSAYIDYERLYFTVKNVIPTFGMFVSEVEIKN